MEMKLVEFLYEKIEKKKERKEKEFWLIQVTQSYMDTCLICDGVFHLRVVCIDV